MLHAECQINDWENGHKGACSRICQSKKGKNSVKSYHFGLRSRSSTFGAEKLGETVKNLSWNNLVQQLVSYHARKGSDLEKQHQACFVPGTVCEAKLSSGGEWLICVVRSVDRNNATAEICFLDLNVTTVPMHHMRWKDHQACDRRASRARVHGDACGDVCVDVCGNVCDDMHVCISAK